MIIIKNEKSKEKIPKEFKKANILTVHEAKGLEFNDVFLFNFFTDSDSGSFWEIMLGNKI